MIYVARHHYYLFNSVTIMYHVLIIMYFCVLLRQILCLSLLLCICCDILMALSIVTPNSRPCISYLIFGHTRSLLFDASLHEHTEKYVSFLQRKVNRNKCYYNSKSTNVIPTTVIKRSSGELVITSSKCHRTPKVTLSKVL